MESQQDKKTRFEKVNAYFFKTNEQWLKITGCSYFNSEGVKEECSITPADKIVYSVMFNRFTSFVSDSENSGVYFDNQADIAERTGLEESTVNRIIRKLCEIGVVLKFCKTIKGAGARKSASYVVRDLFSLSNVEWFYKAQTDGAKVLLGKVSNSTNQPTVVKKSYDDFHMADEPF